MDIAVARDLNDWNQQSGSDLSHSGWVSMVHEFGHFFGFGHVSSSSHSVMRPAMPEPVTGGVNFASIWPTDALGVHNHYSQGSQPNLVVSSQGVVNGVLRNLDTGVSYWPRGSTQRVSFYLGNMGAVAASNIAIRIRASSVGPLSGGYTTSSYRTLYTGTQASMAAHSEGYGQFPVSIPTSIATGVYYLYFDVDFNGSVAEFREEDNTTVSAMKFVPTS